MGIKRPLRPQVAAKYGAELSQAEKMAKMGYDPKTGKLNEAIYGPTEVGSFDPFEEMKILQEANVTDDSFLLEAQQNFRGEQNMSQPNRIKNALEAVQQEDPDFNPSPVQAVEAPSAPVNKQEVQSDSEEQESKPEQAEPPKPPTIEEVADDLQRMFGPGTPSAAQLHQWKQMHGNIFILPIEDRVFIYRYIKRQEWRQFLANKGWSNMTQEQQEDFIAEKCTLWPKFNSITAGALPAGTANLIAEQIRINSLFLDPGLVSQITIKL